ncbi:MAG: PfkB family carbohydrate kinase [Desulfobacterales bacterium]|nr:PfkB family carbohydrate kinase [Desulfobacterales bacterium]
MVRPAPILPPGRLAHKVAVVGSTTIDCNISEAGRRLKLGGVTTYAGLTYRRRGLAVSVVTRVAAADLHLLSRLAEAGIRLEAPAGRLTTHFVNRIRGGARSQEMPLCAEPIGSLHVGRVLDAVDCIHLGPLHPADLEAEIYRLLRRWPGEVVLDVQGLVRRVDSGKIAPGACAALPLALAAVDILKADAAELRTMLAALGTDLPGLMEAFGIRETVVTDAERGGVIYGPGRRRHVFTAETAPAIEDPTGAGDVFLAAYTAARLADGLEVATAARQAARAAARQIAGSFIPRRKLELHEAEAGPLITPAAD